MKVYVVTKDLELRVYASLKAYQRDEDFVFARDGVLFVEHRDLVREDSSFSHPHIKGCIRKTPEEIAAHNMMYAIRESRFPRA